MEAKTIDFWTKEVFIQKITPIPYRINPVVFKSSIISYCK